MKALLFVVAVACLVLAAVYFMLPAESLPTWLPGYEAGMARMRVKHGVAAAAVGVLALVAGWFVGRRV